jgi:hypothetical protein
MTLFFSFSDPAVKNDIIQGLIAQSDRAAAKNTTTVPMTSSSHENIDQGPAAKRTATKENIVQDTHTQCEKEIVFHVWKDREEDFLVDLRHERHDDFKKIKNHLKLWTEISEQINEELKCNVTALQCSNKYNALKKKWKEIIDSPSGSETKYFRHKSSFDNLFGNKASTKPASTVDSFGEQKEVNDENSNDIKKKAKSKKRKNASSEVIDMFNEQYNDFKKEIQDQHKAKMERMDRFLDLYEKEITGKDQKGDH